MLCQIGARHSQVFGAIDVALHFAQRDFQQFPQVGFVINGQKRAIWYIFVPTLTRCRYLARRRKKLIRAHEITLADCNAIVAQDVIGGSGMEEELRQAIAEQMGLSRQFLFFRHAGT